MEKISSTLDEAAPIKAGKATTIYHPYKGKVPQIANIPTERPNISKENLEIARNSISKSQTRGEIKRIYEERFKKTGGQRTLFVKSTLNTDGKFYPVAVNKSCIGKVISEGNLTAEKLSVLDKIDSIIVNGEYVGSGKYIPHGNRIKSTVRFDYFETPITIGSEKYIVRFDVEVFPGSNNYRTHNVIKEMDLIHVDGADLGTSPSAKSTETSPSTSILQSSQNSVNKNNLVKKDIPKGSPNKTTNKLERLYQSTVDSQYTIGKAIKGIDQTADRNAKILASNSRNAAGTVDYSIKNGLVDMGGKQVTKTSLQQIFDSVPDIDAFNSYLLHKHNIDRFREGKPIFGNEITSTDSANIVKKYELQYPQFKALGEAVKENNDKLIDEWLVKGGLIPKELGDKLKVRYKNYVPTFREGTIDTSRYSPRVLKASTTVKTAVGSDKPVIAPNISIGVHLNSVIRAVRKNEIYQGLLDAVRKDPERMKNFAVLADDSNANLYGKTITKNAVDNVELDDLNKITDTLIGQDKTGRYFVTALENGKPVRMNVSEDLYKTLKSLDEVETGTLDKAADIVKKYATNPFKSLVTGYNPFFALRNIARDLPTSYIQGTENNPIKWTANLIDAAKQMRKDSETYKEFKALGGKQGGYFNQNRGIAPQSLPSKVLKRVGDKVFAFNESTETLPRFAEYLGTLKREGNSYAAKQQALYNAGEVTVNFARNGKAVEAADKVIPYLNPAVQGIDKFARSMSKPANVVKAINALSVPTVALYMLNHKTDEDAKNYDMLDNRTKDTYFVIPTGDGKYIKIPKSREAGALFSSLPERIVRHMKGNEEAFKGFGNTVTTNFAPQNPIENNIFTPATLNLARNKDFANRTIVPASMLNDKRSAYLQYDDTTSELSKWIGNAVRKLPGMEEGLSPKQIDYLIDSYTGIIGDILLPATTSGENPIKNVLIKPFTADTVYNNEIQNRFYGKYDEATKAKTESNLLNNIPSEWVTPEEKKLSVYNKASLEMSDIRKQINKAKANGATENELRELRKQLNQIATSAPKNAEETYKEYLKTYIPEISGMSKKQQTGYREYASNVNPQDYYSAHVGTKNYKSDLGKAISIFNGYENANAISKGLGYSDKAIQNAQAISELGVSAAQYEDIRKTSDLDGNGYLKNIEIIQGIDSRTDLTDIQKAYMKKIMLQYR